MAKYCNISLFDVYELSIYEYWYLLRDAMIYEYNKSEEGQKYLDNAWRLKQTNGDKDKLRKMFRMEGNSE